MKVFTLRRRLGLSLMLIQLATFAAAAPDSAVPARILIRAGHVLDVHSGNETADQTIVVTGDLITAISASSATPAQPQDQEIDLRSMTVLPGLIDVHTHLTMDSNFDPYHMLSASVAKSALIGAHNAKVTLEAGFTSVRNVHAEGYSDVDLRDAINEGLLEGPHMQVSGPALGITGGHCDDNLLPIQFHVQGGGVADGIEAVQHKVRETIKYGADLIKICATGGVLSKGDDPQASQYTREELKAIVADAHRLGRKVAAHAHGAQGILWATEAGVDSIEHGSYMNDEDLAAMKAHGTYFVPTAYLIDWIQANGHLPLIYQQKREKVGAIDPGKWADIIAVKGDPLRDVKLLQHVSFVMKSGVVYKIE